MRRVLAVAILVAACGGKDDSAATTTTPKTPVKAELPPEGSAIDAFHAALAPKWHAVGMSRMQETCGAVPDLHTKMAAVRAAGAPGDLDPGAWGSAAKKVETTLAKLKSACGGTDQKAFEAAFTQLHWAFHDYMDLVVGDHGHGLGDGRGGRQGIPRPPTKAPAPPTTEPATP